MACASAEIEAVTRESNKTAQTGAQSRRRRAAGARLAQDVLQVALQVVVRRRRHFAADGQIVRGRWGPGVACLGDACSHIRLQNAAVYNAAVCAVCLANGVTSWRRLLAEARA